MFHMEHSPVSAPGEGHARTFSERPNVAAEVRRRIGHRKPNSRCFTERSNGQIEKCSTWNIHRYSQQVVWVLGVSPCSSLRPEPDSIAIEVPRFRLTSRMLMSAGDTPEMRPA